ncbi:MAG: hypothetical protein QGG89_11135, partial [Vicinamibacterales bacterium]|nr:hypothetical protein [Vicinamibacterales bacterium]
ESVRQHLPRATREELVTLLDADIDTPARGLEHLVEATLAAACLADLEGRSADVVAARTAAVHVAGPGVRAGEVAALLDVGLRSVTRMRARPALPQLVEAIHGQLRLRSHNRRR